MDLSKIGNRMASGYYESLDSLFQDFILMFDNACRYNEPESVVYKVRVGFIVAIFICCGVAANSLQCFIFQ